MKKDVRSTLHACYCFDVPQTSPEYYLTDQYHTYRQRLAEFARQETLVQSLLRGVHDCFPDAEIVDFLDLVANPSIWFESPIPELEEGFVGSLISYRLHVSGLGPFWHLEVEVEELDEEHFATFGEPSIPEELAANHQRLVKLMTELKFREVPAEEAWQPVDFPNHLRIPHPYVRVGHLLFNSNSAFGVEDFEEILLGLHDDLDDDEDEMWFDEEEGGPVRFH